MQGFSLAELSPGICMRDEVRCGIGRSAYLFYGDLRHPPFDRLCRLIDLDAVASGTVLAEQSAAGVYQIGVDFAENLYWPRRRAQTHQRLLHPFQVLDVDRAVPRP